MKGIPLILIGLTDRPSGMTCASVSEQMDAWEAMITNRYFSLEPGRFSSALTTSDLNSLRGEKYHVQLKDKVKGLNGSAYST